MARPPVRVLLFFVGFIGFLGIVDLLGFGFNRRAVDSLTSSTSAVATVPQQKDKWYQSKWLTSSSKLDFIPPRPNAGFVILCRDTDLNELLPALTDMESTFNSHPLNQYPYIFLNDQTFSDFFMEKIRDFMEGERKRLQGPKATKPDLRFGSIPEEDWKMPESIDRKKAEFRWGIMAHSHIPYAKSESYRNMCRWQSGAFFRHALVKDLEYYWRIEPSVRFTCSLVPGNGAAPTSWDLHANGTGDFFDPFRWMKQTGKKYGWVLALKEYQATIKSLWPRTRKWMLEHPEYHSDLGLLDFVLKKDKVGYNLCHFWSNFEIAALDFYQSEGYREYFKMLDSTGMFYYERTGDAPVHSVAAAWLLSKDQVHLFQNIGYYHLPFTACPRGPQYASKCSCDPHTNFDYDVSNFSCQREWDLMMGINSTENIIAINQEMGLSNFGKFALLNIPHG